MAEKKKTSGGRGRFGVPRKARQRRQLSDGRVPFQGYIMLEGLKELKKLAAEQDRPYTDLVAEAIDDLFTKYNRPRLARPESD